ncbi:MAG TPA: 16S rRNA (guanine(527)-N(7))-methyltransferase RsmG [Solirubrobacterales bacterium]|nr:16S rRNA (guanine(527)-N(7))-methyltransferase RsmG [Solirubrobacterales bacterium]
MATDERPWLTGDLVQSLEPMLTMLVAEPTSLSSVTNPDEARRVHLADSLSGLAVDEVNSATRCADIGSGAGFPGIPLAKARPEAEFVLIDSVGKKVRFIDSVIDELAIGNARAVHARSEEWAKGEGAEAYDLVTARAVAPLEALAELASPLLEEGGSLVAWKGERELDEESKLATLEERLAMRLDRVVAVRPYRSSRERNLYVVKKTGPTPEGLPRRPGMVRKRPLSA